MPISKINAIKTTVTESGNIIMEHDTAITNLIHRALRDYNETQ
jgi:hypothetical protein